MKALLFGFLAFVLFASCQSAEVPEVSEDATPLEIVQLAQTAYDSGFENRALTYYNILLERYGLNSSVYVEGRFEIAHIYVKQKKYDVAQPILEEVLAIYDAADFGTLPGAYRKLAQNDLDKCIAETTGDTEQ